MAYLGRITHFHTAIVLEAHRSATVGVLFKLQLI